MGSLLLVRHGQASFGADDYDVLSPAGWDQSRRLGAWLVERGVRPDAVLAGRMRRHAETAEGAGWSLEVDAGWDEFDHLGVVRSHLGQVDAAGLDRRAFQEAFVEATRKWRAGEGEYDESFAAFSARVRAALERACERAGSGRTVAVVTSGGPIAVACAALTGGDWGAFNTPCVNTGVTTVVVGSTGSRLLTFNEHAHLPREEVTYR